MKEAFACRSCGTKLFRRVGKCPSCDSWGTIEPVDAGARASMSLPRGAQRPAPGRGQEEGEQEDEQQDEGPTTIALSDVDAEDIERIPTGIAGLDRVLGGEEPGLAKGSVVLLGGEAGIGKSTLLLQAASSLAASGHDVFYGAGEEMLSQIAARGARIGCPLEGIEAFPLIDHGGDLDALLDAIDASSCAIDIVDSLQVITDKNVRGEPGRVAQVQNAAHRLTQRAKRESDPRTIIIVCQATKDGDLAGPNAVRHIVDAVLYFEGEEGNGPRWLRTRGKNRYGPTPIEQGFSMTDAGLVDLGEKVRRLEGKRSPGRPPPRRGR